MKTISVESMWKEYAKRSLEGIDKYSIQYRECRKSFYAGVGQTILEQRETLGTNDVSEEEGVAALQDMLNQCMAFWNREFDEFKEEKAEAHQDPKKLLLPRFRGNAVQKGSAWGWEAFITLARNDEPINIQSKGTFISKEAALVDMRDHSVKMLKEVCTLAKIPIPDDFIDLNEGLVRPASDFERKK